MIYFPFFLFISCMKTNHFIYPEQLKQIYDPPLVLFAQGRTELLGGTGLGVVGTRRPTPYRHCGYGTARW